MKLLGLGGGPFQNGAHESRRARHQGRPVDADLAGQRRGRRGVGMVDHADAALQRHQPRHRQAETVEGRQKAQHRVLACQPQHFQAGTVITEQVAVRQGHGLGGLFRTAGEQDDGRLIGGNLRHLGADAAGPQPRRP